MLSIDPPPLKEDGCVVDWIPGVLVLTILPAPDVGVGVVVLAVELVVDVGWRVALIAARTSQPLALAAAIAELTAIKI